MAEMEVLDQHGAALRVALKGRLDTLGVERLERQFGATVGPSGKPAILDFSGVTFLSSMGIRMLVSAAKDLSKRGQKLIILSPQGLVRESIVAAALQRLMPVADSDEDATRALAAS